MDYVKIKNIKFISSKDILIQISDYLTGKTLRIYEDIVNLKPISKNTRDLIKILKPIISGNCNTVSSSNDDERFFNEFSLKTSNTLIPWYY